MITGIIIGMLINRALMAFLNRKRKRNFITYRDAILIYKFLDKFSKKQKLKDFKIEIDDFKIVIDDEKSMLYGFKENDNIFFKKYTIEEIKEAMKILNKPK